MYATNFCPDCRRAKQFMKLRQIPFEEIDIEENPDAAEFVKHANQGKRKVPTFEVNGRIFHCSPFDPEKMAQELGV
jgi:mycoredoxin